VVDIIHIIIITPNNTGDIRPRGMSEVDIIHIIIITPNNTGDIRLIEAMHITGMPTMGMTGIIRNHIGGKAVIIIIIKRIAITADVAITVVAMETGITTVMDTDNVKT
jgi:hypothetical protein